MLIGHLPHRLSHYLYNKCVYGNQNLGCLTSLRFQPKWVSRTWKLTATGMNWGNEAVVEFGEEDVWALRVLPEPVSVTELATSLAKTCLQVMDLLVANFAYPWELREARQRMRHLTRIRGKILLASGHDVELGIEIIDVMVLFICVIPFDEKYHEILTACL